MEIDKKFLIKCIIFYPIYLLSFFTIRNKKKICFGGGENAKYLYLKYVMNGERCIWITHKVDEINYFRSLNLEAYKRNSFKGIYHALTSKIFVFTHGISNINIWAARGAILVNLFHGLPLKKISKDDNKHKTSFWLKYICPSTQLPYHLQLSTTDYISGIFKHAFNLLPNACVNSVYPRNQFMYMTKDEIIDFLKSVKDYTSLSFIRKIRDYDRVYIYMPTWRDSEVDFIQRANFDCNKLNAALKKNNAIFIFKLHPYTKLDKADEISKYSNLLFVDSEVGLYPILPFTDVLVTDYSSVYLDYILMKEKSIMLFQYDIKEYIAKERDLYIDVTKLPGLKYFSFDDMLSGIESNVKDSSDKKEIVNKYWSKDKDTSELDKRLLSYTM